MECKGSRIGEGFAGIHIGMLHVMIIGEMVNE